jgi:hypothetical protein
MPVAFPDDLTSRWTCPASCDAFFSLGAGVREGDASPYMIVPPVGQLAPSLSPRTIAYRRTQYHGSARSQPRSDTTPIVPHAQRQRYGFPHSQDEVDGGRAHALDTSACLPPSS